jgi:hypothetical protein
VLAQHAFAGAGLLDFGNDRRPARSHLGAQCGFKGAQVGTPLGRFGIGAQAGRTAQLLLRPRFLRV